MMSNMQSSGSNNLDDIGRFRVMPRTVLGHFPTPLEFMPNLTRQTGGAKLYVKRDDCTGLAFGGNKVRQLEFYLGEAVVQGADTILITGAVQSNFVRTCAAAARKLGMDCHVQLEERVRDPGPAYRVSGNVLLDRLLGATIHSYPDGEDEEGADRRLQDIADELSATGKHPYVVPLSAGHPPLGALGYIAAAEEILTQLATRELHIDEIVVASGSGTTHAGLLFGLRALGSSISVQGICVRRNADAQVPRIHQNCEAIAGLLQMEPVVVGSDVQCDDCCLAPGYGTLNEQVIDAIKSAARCEALFVDPVYTGRTMAGAIAAARDASPDKNILMIHTGGQPGLFAYEPELTSVT